MKVMVVDDSMIIRKTLANIFIKYGHEVIAEASSGFEAIQSYKKYKPDMVTMDISMPMLQDIKNGIEALEKIKEFDSEANVAMVTSHGEEELVMDAIKLGAKGYILKPITDEKVSELIEKMFP